MDKYEQAKAHIAKLHAQVHEQPRCEIAACILVEGYDAMRADRDRWKNHHDAVVKKKNRLSEKYKQVLLDGSAKNLLIEIARIEELELMLEQVIKYKPDVVVDFIEARLMELRTGKQDA